MLKMEEEIRNKLFEISKNLNGNHKRSIKELNKVIDDINEIIDNLKEDRNLKIKKNIMKMGIFFMLGIAFIIIVQATINYNIRGETKLKVGENETIVTNVLRGIEQVLLEESISFRTLLTNEEIFSLYRADSSQSFNNVSEDFNGALIHQMSQPNNIYAMEECWWDKDEQLMHFCINHGATQRATTIRRSLQIVGNETVKENDRNFTLCEGANYIDCSTDVTGADLFVQDDIEAQSIYANGLVYGIAGIFPIITSTGTLSANNISVNNIFADYISASNINATQIYADRIDATCICYDGGCLGTC